MRIDLTGRRALVTGGGSGIGAAIARALGQCAADVAVHYGSNAAGADAVVQEICGAGGRAVSTSGDLTDPAQAAAAVNRAVEAFGGLDIVVNNAGRRSGPTLAEETDDDHWASVLNVNVSTAFYTTRAAIPHLRASSAGRIVMMSSVAAETGGDEDSVAYVAAKAAVIGLTRGLAKELAHDEVTVNALAPGFIEQTPFQDTDKIASTIPLGRSGTVDDVNGVVAFLCSKWSSFVTGQVIGINGGSLFR